MAMFRYEAIDKTGKVVRGVMDAADEQAVMQRLMAMGYSAKAVAPSPGTATASRQAAAPQVNPGANARSSTPVPISVKSVVPIRQLSIFFRQLAVSSRAGIPLFQTLSDVRPGIRNRKLARAVDYMIDQVNRGAQLSTAMAAFPHIFPVWATSLVWAGELGGFREIALDDIAARLEKEASELFWARIGWGIFKINLIFFILCLPFAQIGESAITLIAGESDSSYLTIFWGKVWPILLHQAIPVCILIIIFWIVWGHVKRVPSVRHALDGMLLSVPVWGLINRERSIARFLRTLQTLYAAGVQPKPAWDASSLTAYNSVIAARLKQGSDIFTQHRTLYDAFAMCGVLPIDETYLVQTAEKSGQIPDTVERMAKIHDEQAEHTRMVARFWSVSLLFTSLILATGIFAIMLARSWRHMFDALFKMTGL
ncbi:MAG TPA: type II secretion system F family protein [Armatimonadota bacterium]|nr:type II secretion system F family protein [Armatimonadota bacterium]